jgi:hypothetical protein
MMAQAPLPLPAGETKNNNQLAMGACDKEGKGGKGIETAIRVVGDKEEDGVCDGGGVQQREQWLWRQEQW